MRFTTNSIWKQVDRERSVSEKCLGRNVTKKGDSRKSGPIMGECHSPGLWETWETILCEKPSTHGASPGFRKLWGLVESSFVVLGQVFRKQTLMWRFGCKKYWSMCLGTTPKEMREARLCRGRRWRSCNRSLSRHHRKLWSRASQFVSKWGKGTGPLLPLPHPYQPDIERELLWKGVSLGEVSYFIWGIPQRLGTWLWVISHQRSVPRSWVREVFVLKGD